MPIATLQLLISLLTQEVTLLEQELAQQTAVVATTTPIIFPQEIFTPEVTPPQPILQNAPITPTVYVPAPTPLPQTTAWIEVNGATGTVEFKPGTYSGTESWGSTNATSCTVGGGDWSGNFGTSGTRGTGLISKTPTTLSITCDNDASSSVTVITQ